MRDVIVEADDVRKTYDTGAVRVAALQGIDLRVAKGVAARSVVERRQQIGVMRSIGFQAATVRLGFLLESGFLALTSIVVGSVLGLALAYNVVDDAHRQATWPGVHLMVPWANLVVIFAVVLAVALAATYLPARRASRVYPAEALRYE